jgi:hypothetical protein
MVGDAFNFHPFSTGQAASIVSEERPSAIRGDAEWLRGKYGLRQGRLGCSRFTAGDAERIADHWLGRNHTGLEAGRAEALPGHYTLQSERDGKVVGMLSVNASTGAVWYHWWQGRFGRMAE